VRKDARQMAAAKVAWGGGQICVAVVGNLAGWICSGKRRKDSGERRVIERDGSGPGFWFGVQFQRSHGSQCQ
jgi:hypothetical protein